MSKLSCDITYIYRTSTCHKFILIVRDEVINNLMAILLNRVTSNETGDAVQNYVFCKHGPPSYQILDEDQKFISSVMQYIYKRLGIKIKALSCIISVHGHRKTYKNHV